MNREKISSSWFLLIAISLFVVIVPMIFGFSFGEIDQAEQRAKAENKQIGRYMISTNGGNGWSPVSIYIVDTVTGEVKEVKRLGAYFKDY